MILPSPKATVKINIFHNHHTLATPSKDTLKNIKFLFWDKSVNIFITIKARDLIFSFLFFCLYNSTQAEIRINHVGFLVTDVWAISQIILKMNELLYGASLHNRDTQTLFFCYVIRVQKNL